MVGVLSGTSKNGTIEIVFETYFQAQEENSLEMYLSEQFNGLSSGLFSDSSNSSKFKVLTFDNFQREGDARYATHEIIGQNNKPLLEFLGPGLETISFSILLMASLGVNPLEELQKLRQMRDEGVICNFTIGTEEINKNQWVVNKISESHKYFDGKGQVIGASVNVNLQEYSRLPKEALQ